MHYYGLIINFYFFVLNNIYLLKNFVVILHNNHLLNYFYFVQCGLNLLNGLNFFICLNFVNYLNAIFRILFKRYELISYGFLKFFFFLIIGLGFKKKTSRYNFFFIFVGNRHWVRLNFINGNFYFNIRKRNLILFVENKKNLHYYLAFTKNMRKETAFKTKGIMLSRVWVRKRIPRSILFARRVKYSILRLKLSKKQKFI